jgi:predicted AAA+ superfamily ATPase
VGHSWRQGWGTFRCDLGAASLVKFFLSDDFVPFDDVVLLPRSVPAFIKLSTNTFVGRTSSLHYYYLAFAVLTHY